MHFSPEFLFFIAPFASLPTGFKNRISIFIFFCSVFKKLYSRQQIFPERSCILEQKASKIS